MRTIASRLLGFTTPPPSQLANGIRISARCYATGQRATNENERGAGRSLCMRQHETSLRLTANMCVCVCESECVCVCVCVCVSE